MKTTLTIIGVAFALICSAQNDPTNRVNNPAVGSITRMRPEIAQHKTNLIWHTVTIVTNREFIDTITMESAITNAVRYSLITTNMIEALCASGEVCKVKGHQWRPGPPRQTENFAYAFTHPNTAFRTCELCGVCQSQDLNWK